MTRTNYRMRGVRSCVLVAAIAREGGAMSDTQLRERIGQYATNVITGLEDLGLIYLQHDGREERWALAPEGRKLARALLGERFVDKVNKSRS